MIDGVDAEKARKKGPINVSTAWCGYSRCCKHKAKFKECLKRGVGVFASHLERVRVPTFNMS